MAGESTAVHHNGFESLVLISFGDTYQLDLAKYVVKDVTCHERYVTAGAIRVTANGLQKS